MSKYIKRTIAAFLLACFFCTSAMAATITPSKSSITFPKGTETVSFDVILEADAAKKM